MARFDIKVQEGEIQTGFYTSRKGREELIIISKEDRAIRIWDDASGGTYDVLDLCFGNFHDTYVRISSVTITQEN